MQTHTLVQAAIENALIEHLCGQGTRIEVSLRDGVVTVRDDGRGMRTDHMVPVLCDERCAEVFGGGIPRLGLTELPFGLAVVNAHTAWTIVQSDREGVRTQAIASRGHLLQQPTVMGPASLHGTTVRFAPLPTMGPADASALRATLSEVLRRCPSLTVALDGQPFG